jgi:hypothetical protein
VKGEAPKPKNKTGGRRLAPTFISTVETAIQSIRQSRK